jgi:hypothetical protein
MVEAVAIPTPWFCPVVAAWYVWKGHGSALAGTGMPPKPSPISKSTRTPRTRIARTIERRCASRSRDNPKGHLLVSHHAVVHGPCPFAERDGCHKAGCKHTALVLELRE